MALYHYKARDKTGKLVEATVEADSEGTIAAKLRQMGYLPVAINQAAGEVQVKAFGIFDRFRGVKLSDVNVFSRQLFTLQKAGLPLLTSLNSLKVQTTNAIFKDVIEQIAKDIEGGATLSSALAKHPRVFDHLYTSMIKSGEVSGKLDEILQRLAVLGEHEEIIRMRIKAAMRYPMIVVCAIVIGFLVLVTLVMPRFAHIYGQFNVALPLPTQILLGIHYMVTKFWWLLIIVAIGFIFLWQKFVNTKGGRFWWDNLKLKLPVFGPLFLKLTMSRFCRIMGSLIRSGVPILQILELVSDSLGNVVISKTINDIKTSVNEGKGMSGPMKASGMFPVVVVQMVSVGEETGKLDELLLHVSDYYDFEVEHIISNLVSLIEPMLILVLGLAVLFMALGIFLPMWSLMNLFQH